MYTDRPPYGFYTGYYARPKPSVEELYARANENLKAMREVRANTINVRCGFTNR